MLQTTTISSSFILLVASYPSDHISQTGILLPNLLGNKILPNRLGMLARTLNRTLENEAALYAKRLSSIQARNTHKRIR